ncbi:MAG: hypothetical protein WCW14_03805 [Candidatus Paceibacterota bacterium]|jgi:hypothetical protein
MSETLIQQEERTSNPEKLLSKFERLTEEEISSIGEKFNLAPEVAREKILHGLNMLGATFVVDGHGGISEYMSSIPMDEYIETPIQTPAKLNIGELGVDDFGIFFRNDKLLSLVGATKVTAEKYYKLPFSYNGQEAEGIYWFCEFFSEGEFSKIIIPNQLHPHPDRTFSYGIFSPEGQLYGIIPIESSTKDREIIAPNLDNFRQIFLRGDLTPEDEKLLLQYSSEVNREVALVNGRLGIPHGFIQNQELILEAGEHHGAFSITYKDGEENPHHLLFFSRNRVENMKDRPANRARVFRHEYIHNLDSALGDGEHTFSELISDEMLIIISKHLFAGDKLLRMDYDQSKINWPNKAKVYTTFTETHVFPGPGLGHSEENIRELFVSIMNVYLDPFFEEALQSRPESERLVMKQLYTELGKLVQSRIIEAVQRNKESH